VALLTDAQRTIEGALKAFRNRKWDGYEWGDCMKILAPTQGQCEGQFAVNDLLTRVDQWKPALPLSPLPYEEFGEDYLLGSSRTGDLWIFAAFPLRPSVDPWFPPEGSHLVALLDPPAQEPRVIAEILLRVHIARTAGDTRDQELYREILNEVSFPVYPLLKQLLPEAPPEWHVLPVELDVSFGLSEVGCLTRGLFDDYQRDNVEDALKVLFDKRVDCILIGYALEVRGAIPFVAWDVDWPLSRRGVNPPRRREKVQGDYPWELESSSVLLYVYQYMPSYNWYGTPPAYGEPSVRLQVAGRTAAEAIANYHQCAKALRRIKRRLLTVGQE